jgi:hypothetical protein
MAQRKTSHNKLVRKKKPQEKINEEDDEQT